VAKIIRLVRLIYECEKTPWPFVKVISVPRQQHLNHSEGLFFWRNLGASALRTSHLCAFAFKEMERVGVNVRAAKNCDCRAIMFAVSGNKKGPCHSHLSCRPATCPRQNKTRRLKP